MVLRAWRANNLPCGSDPAQYRHHDPNMGKTDLVWDVMQSLNPIKCWIDANGPISTFIVLAGVTPATGSEMGDNITIAKAYLEAARTLGIPRVLLASSSAVYGAGNGEEISESEPCLPINAYGISKLKMEHLALSYREAGTEVCCLRIGNVAGADALLLNALDASTNSPLVIDCFPDGHGPQRSYIGPAALGDILCKLAHHATQLPFLLNVAALEPIYMEELANAAGLPWAPREPSPDASQRIVLNCKRLADLIPLQSGMGAASTLISEWRKFG